MKTKKTLNINGQKVDVELRVCANHNCSREFWTALSSGQSICGISCWEFSNHRIWRRGEKQPKIRRPGEKASRKKKGPKKKGGSDNFRRLTDADWALRIAKLKSAAKGGQDRPFHPQSSQAL